MDGSHARPPHLSRRLSTSLELPGESPAQLNATVVPDGTVTRVRLAGDLELSTLAALDPVVDQVLSTEPSTVLLDLSDLTFCDARGLAGLLSVRRRLGAAGLRLTLTGARPPLRRLFEVTHLDRVFQVEEAGDSRARG